MSLLNTITDSNQIMSVIEDTGDNVLKLAFVETEAPVDQIYSLQKRYSFGFINDKNFFFTYFLSIYII